MFSNSHLHIGSGSEKPFGFSEQENSEQGERQKPWVSKERTRRPKAAQLSWEEGERPLVVLNKNMAEAYCVKCKSKREMNNAKEVSMKGKGGTKRRAMTGVCQKCGTKMFRILGK